MTLSLRVENNYIYHSFADGYDYTHKLQFLKAVTQACNISYSTFVSRSSGPKFHERFYNLSEKGRFPSSLLGEVISMLPPNFPPIEVQDDRVYKDLDPVEFNFPYNLDIFQQNCIELGLENRRGWFLVPTGGGKTGIFISLIGNINGITLVVEPSIDLVKQISEDIEKYSTLKTSKIIGVDSLYNMKPDSTVAVASIATLLSNFDTLVKYGWFDQFDTLVFDEVHHMTLQKGSYSKKTHIRKPPGTSGYFKVAMACNAPNRFGFTGTEKDGEIFKVLVKAALGEKLYTVIEDDLIKMKRISRPHFLIYEHKVPFYDTIQKATKEGIYLNYERNLAIINFAKFLSSIGRSCLIMIDNKINHLKALKSVIEEVGLKNYKILTGEQKDKDKRKAVYDQLHHKEINIIILTIGKEGVNIPSVDAIIRGSGKKANTLVNQEKGRGMRMTTDKDKVLIMDFFDDDGYKKVRVGSGSFRTKQGTLKKHSLMRVELYKEITEGSLTIVKNFEDLKLTTLKIFRGEI